MTRSERSTEELIELLVTNHEMYKTKREKRRTWKVVSTGNYRMPGEGAIKSVRWKNNEKIARNRLDDQVTAKSVMKKINTC